MTTPACHERGEARVRWTPRPDGCEESVQFRPGYNCPDAHGHGVHGMEIRWYLRGPRGAVWLRMSTDWIPGELRPGHGLPPSGLIADRVSSPDGRGTGYHARVPQYEGQEIESGNCDLIGVPCYCDANYGGADEPVERFVAEGERAIWDALESAYADLKTGGES